MWHSIEELLIQIGEQIRTLKEKIDAEQIIMDELKKAGLIYAGTWWKGGKYLYLIHPSDGFGYRKREYIGADTEKIAEAMAGIDRGRKYDDAKSRQSMAGAKLNAVQQCLIHTHRAGE